MGGFLPKNGASRLKTGPQDQAQSQRGSGTYFYTRNSARHCPEGPDAQGGVGRALTQDPHPPSAAGAQLHAFPPFRRSPSYIICNTTSSDEVLDMKVTVQVDRAKIQQDLLFRYVEDPTIVRIEPDWSIVR